MTNKTSQEDLLRSELPHVEIILRLGACHGMVKLFRLCNTPKRAWDHASYGNRRWLADSVASALAANNHYGDAHALRRKVIEAWRGKRTLRYPRWKQLLEWLRYHEVDNLRN